MGSPIQELALRLLFYFHAHFTVTAPRVSQAVTAPQTSCGGNAGAGFVCVIVSAIFNVLMCRLALKNNNINNIYLLQLLKCEYLLL